VLTRSLTTTIIITAIQLSPTTAAAQTSTNPEGEYYYTEYQQKWYGWQNLAIDIPTLTAFNIAQAKHSHATALVFMGVFAVGAPVIHVAHRRPIPAFVSGFTHILLPLGGYALERAVFKTIMPNVSLDTRNAIAITAGSVAATAIDVFVLSFEQTEHLVEVAGSGSVPQSGFQFGLTGKSAWVGWQF